MLVILGVFILGILAFSRYVGFPLGVFAEEVFSWVSCLVPLVCRFGKFVSDGVTQTTETMPTRNGERAVAERRRAGLGQNHTVARTTKH